MSNLLEKASILLTPTAYDDGKILSVKPEEVLGSELMPSIATIANLGGGSITQITENIYSSTSDGTSGSAVRPKFDFNTTAGKTYKLVITPIGTITGTINFDFYDGSTYLFQDYDFTTIKEITFTDNGTVFGAFNGQLAYSISNFKVSIKEQIDGDFDFTRNSSATRVNSQGLIEDMQILSSNLVSNGDFSQEGSQLITNGDFATDSNWSYTTGWEISDGKANFTNTSSKGIYQAKVLDANKTYKVSFDYNGTGQVGFLGTAGGSNTLKGFANYPNGNNVIYITPTTTTTAFNIWGNWSGAFSIDNVSVKEVGQDWTFTSGATLTALGAKITHTPSAGSVSQPSVLTIGKSYKLTYEITESVSGGLKFNSAVNASMVTTVGVHTKYLEADNTIVTFGRTSSSNNDVTITNISVIEITEDTNLPRIDYTGGVGHWLFEPQSTNLITQSENLSNMQIAFGGAITLDSNFINPSGQNGSYFIYDTDGGTQSRFRVSNSGFTLGDKLSYSVFLKSNSSSLITIGGNYGGENCTFNVGSKTLISQGAAVDSYEIINFTNGWTRYIVNTTFTNTVPGNAYPFFTTNATLSEKIYLWGHQLEVQSFATSYIPTSGSTVTRLQDAAFGAGSSDLINSTEGVLYAEIAKFQDDNDNLILLSLNNSSDNSDHNTVTIGFDGDDDFFIRVKANNANAFVSNDQTSSKDVYYKVALSYKSGDSKIYINGNSITPNSGSLTNAFSFGSTLDNLSFDYNGNGVLPFFGKAKCVAVFKEALTDAELTCLTTI